MQYEDGLQVMIGNKIHANQSENSSQIMKIYFIRIFIQPAVYRQIRIYCYEAGLKEYSHRIMTYRG
jgi:hypothetical protein